MPRTALPPTPGSSSDIKGRAKLLPLQISFELPPPAISGGLGVPSSTLTAAHATADDAVGRGAPDSSVYPLQASEMVKARRRTSTAQPKGQFALPPPPTRQRKIIQMKPRQDVPTLSPAASPVITAKRPAAAVRTRNAPDSNNSDATASSSNLSSPTRTKIAADAAGTRSAVSSAAAAAAAAAETSTTSSAGTKRKQASSATAAGRKIARKTAHSLIERRRRSKMNEGFALLRSMIPACTDDMHKLNILQASIDYIKYLEDCNSKLKAQLGSDARSRSSVASASGMPTPSGREPHEINYTYPSFKPSNNTYDQDVDMEIVDDDDDEEDEDDNIRNNMAEDEGDDEDGQVSPRSIPAAFRLPPPSQSRLPSISPALYAADSRLRHRSYSSASTSVEQNHYSCGVSSVTTSPAVGPQTYGGGGGGGGPYHSNHSTAGSELTSPALPPMRDLDQEGTAALLMLADTASGARGPPATGRGMSVSDLLIK